MLRVLAGPIVRRVEPRLACFWVALDQPCKVAADIYLEAQTAGSLPDATFQGEVHSIRIQSWLHVALVTVDLTGNPNVFEPERIYSYNLRFTPDAGAPADLRSLQLLVDRATPGKPHLALGYATDVLPTFALPPRQLTDLRIMHASCRRPSSDVPDALRWIDDVILSSRTDPRLRPHQLFLTGDQIYADDVSAPMLACLMKACALEGDLQEVLPTTNDSGIKVHPGDAAHFPPGMRYNLTIQDARFTSADGTSHVLTLGEFCALNLFAWSNELWPDPEAFPAAADVYRDLTALPPDIWRVHTGLPGDDASAKMKKAAKKPFGDGFLENVFTFDLGTVNQVLNHLRTGARLDSYNRHLRIMRDFWAGLPKVRRAMANVPVYMMFDDHEVTDDWNYSAIWRDRVFTSPLGRTVLRNGMVTYAVFQGWGNDPKKFAEGSNKELLDRIPQLFPPGETLPPANSAADAIDLLLGLGGDADPKVRWNYTVPGQRHLVIVLDLRTRRTFATRSGPPGNLSDAALKDQVPAPPLAPNIEAVVVVSSLTVLGPPIFDALFAPALYRVFDLSHGNEAAIPGMHPDAIEAWPNDEVALEKLLAALAPFRKVVILSGDVHYATGVAMSYWKDRGGAPSRFAQFVSSGARNIFDDRARMVSQCFAFMQQALQFGASPERLGYKKAAPSPVTLPAGVKVSAALDRRLQETPVLLPTEGWPDGTTENATHPPDWAWRLEVIRDVRPDASRPRAVQAAELIPGSPGQDIQGNLEGYRRVAVRHAKQLDNIEHTRQILFASNFGLIYFDGTNVIQDLFAAHPKAVQPDQPDVFSRHVISLQAPAGEAPRIPQPEAAP
jgi:hypothetical protein